MKVKNLLSLLRSVKITVVQKGEVIIADGSISKNIYFIRKGLLRSYLINENGSETTFQLYAESNFFSNTHAILFNEKSRFNYQALETSKLYAIDYESLLEITSRDPELLQLHRSFFGKRVIQQVFQRLESFTFLSPEERYEKFIKDNQNLIQRVPDKYIANVLGITPVSLSRIKNRIAKK